MLTLCPPPRPLIAFCSIKLTGAITSCFCKFDYSGLDEEKDEEKLTLISPSNDKTSAIYQSPYQSPFMTPGTLAKRRAAEKEREREGHTFTKASRGGSFA